MIPIEGLFETHISVRDLERPIAFYRDLVELDLGIVQPERRAAFFWAGGRARSMLGVGFLAVSRFVHRCVQENCLTISNT